ncbi:glycoside hydrolase family 28 protein [Micromonospora sp. NPDC006431]|uniref:glycoside hydrolase family 28 protein n=1 Tax=Micromonospora sp. NPDC006431 TaxID=3364235 RepID=UPI003682633C
MIQRIVDKIETPAIPKRDYVVTDFGAVGDGSADARPAIMAAIKRASQDGGGRVVLPAGRWFSKGPIHLASRIDLHVSEGATLLFSPAAKDYLPVVRTRWEGTELFGYSPLIYANDVHDVAITGKGVIDGNEQHEFHSWTGKQQGDQLRLRQMGFTGVPVEQRIFGSGTYLRPSAVQFFHATRVLLQDYTIHNSPFWINHLVYTDDAIVRNLVVDSHRANNDGVDVDSSTHVLIEKNTFRTGDDSVVVKSGRDLDGRTIGRPSEYIVVRNNDMGGEDGIALGSEMSGDIRHVYFTDNVLRTGASAIRFKGNLDRGGTVEHIRVRNMTVESFDTLIWFQLNYPGELGGNFPPVYRDIVFSDITVEAAGQVLEVHGPQAAPLRDVLLKDIVVKKADKPFVLENVERLRFDNLMINGDRIDGNLDWK